MDLRSDTLRTIKAAADIYESMTLSQKEEITPYVKQIFKIQDEVNKEAEAVYSGKMCAKCKGGCCADGIELGIETPEFLYVMFKADDEQLNRIYSIVESKIGDTDHSCSLIDEGGCVLPSTARPITCKSFHCPLIPGGDEIMEKYSKTLRDAYTSYLVVLNSTGIGSRWVFPQCIEESRN
jgi:hypothetical protein